MANQLRCDAFDASRISGFENSSEFTLHLVRTKYFTTVFGSPDQMIFKVVETVFCTESYFLIKPPCRVA
jgi:hypothetical protein